MAITLKRFRRASSTASSRRDWVECDRCDDPEARDESVCGNRHRGEPGVGKALAVPCEPEPGREACSPDTREDARSGKDPCHAGDGAYTQCRRGRSQRHPAQGKQLGVKQDRPVAHLCVEDQQPKASKDKNPGAGQQDEGSQAPKRIALHDTKGGVERETDCQERRNIQPNPVSEKGQ